ncbi:sulfate adenylyltransferase subunit CysN [Legionella oakridgensis]|uniref:Multifunctional fusion protein n=2 Tax=Legionella oakridgensis TaxID=29423 RepID=W0BB53_9GAMM|nr:sulfate adenylyltransferase subunit CysN [Legionella oakridgensis]AHE65659.1 sulfate adenylyltransferase, large, subunit [Legionella oakridgensis ATCC 33761 = DSM 21215]ETO94535.1 adenylylsulfate kinase/sulfate adenylyltransferase, subunit 1 [Legionella oakridgensis RV-2-2007]KTD38258.1 elongation factor Tu (EF-Tu) [Legionella oakridgensis]STY15610.1 elongation factor Tu (EF-Tu) [Legionella longbeachae]
MHAHSFINNDFTAYLNAHETKSLLRFITCGSVDDGKSTLIGRLLYESHMIYDDQLAALASDSKKFGTTGEGLDFALLVDGLASEREQGITIDVAYRFFSTAKRKFIVADTPGHEQYTRNMATGASTAELAVVMIDARKGVLTQTKRHSFIVSMLGVKNIILAINKMDLVAYDPGIYAQITDEYQAFAQKLGITTIQAIPVSALKGDNIIQPSMHTPWYQGPTLMQHLEDVAIETTYEDFPFRMAVQWINRPNLDFRGFTGRISSGTVCPGDRIKLLPSGKETEIARIVTYDGDLDKAFPGQSVTFTLNDEVDVSRGDVFAAASAPCEIADQFETKLLWMDEQPMIAGRQYLLKTGTKTALCTPSKPKFRLDINTMEHLAAKELTLNEIGCCDIALDRPIAFEPYEINRELGGFILIDRMSNATVAAGLIHFALRRSTNVHPQNLLVDKTMRSDIKHQKPMVLWFTGLSGAGKSTIANLVERQLNALGKHTMLLDGDNIRHGLNRDLGFTEADRAENIRRIAEVAKLMTEAGLITLVSFISPFAAERDMARCLIGNDQFLEIFVDAPLQVVEARDVKGLYKKAKAGKIKNFTGVDSRYEIPETPDLVINTVNLSPPEAAEQVLKLLKLSE